MATTTTAGSPIALLEHQKAHYNRIVAILTYSPSAIDGSKTGLGKTYSTALLAKEYNFPIFLVAPKSVIPNWKAVCSALGVELFFSITYQSLAGKKGHKLSHPWLVRVPRTGKTGVVKEHFEPSEELKAVIEQGILFVVDEVQNTKNKATGKSQAVQCISQAIRFSKSRLSRAIFLSATPFDDEKHVSSFVKTIGLTSYKKVGYVDSDTGEWKPLAFAEVRDRAMKYDPETTKRILAENYPITSKTAAKVMFRLLVEVLKRFLMSEMPVPKKPYNVDMRDGYYLMSTAEAKELQMAIGKLSMATSFSDTDGTVKTDASFGAITAALLDIEKAKVPLFARLARDELKKNPNAKVIIFIHYVDQVLTPLMKHLADLKPMVLQGSMKMEDREAVIKEFQDPNGRRLLLANVAVGGAGISLHDIHGGAPRTTFISPDYKAIELHQAAGRTDRAGTKSDVKIRFVYANIPSGAKETSILNALTRKKEVLKQLVEAQVEAGVKFPGDYDIEKEVRPGVYEHISKNDDE